MGVVTFEKASQPAHSWRFTTGLAELSDGSIVVAGATKDANATEQLAVWRLAPNGTLDTSFGDAGMFTLPTKSRATSAIADGQGVIVGGYAFHPNSGTDMVTLRFSL